MELIIKKDNEKIKGFSYILNILFIIFELLFCFSLITYDNSKPMFSPDRITPSFLYYFTIIFVLFISIIYLFIIKPNFVYNNIKMCKKSLECTLALISSLSIVLDFIFFTNREYKTLMKITFALSFPFIFIVLLRVYEFICKRVKDYIKSLSNFEKKFLIISGIVMLLFMIVSNLISGMFSGSIIPNYDGDYEIYSLDPNHTFKYKPFTNIFSVQNNIRHYFVTLAVYPYTSVTGFITNLIHFEYLFSISYFILMIPLLQTIVIYILRMMNIENNIVRITFIVLFTCSAPFIVHFLIFEKFILPVFFLILTFNAMKNNDNAKYFYYFMAVGTLTTFALLCPIIFFKNIDNLIEFIVNIVIFGLIFLFVLCLCGMFYKIFTIIYELSVLMLFTSDKLAFVKRIIYFFAMIGNLFLLPNVTEQDYYGYYVLVNVEPTTSIIEFYLGIIIFVFCIVSIIINWKNIYTKFATAGFIYTIFMAFIIGYGAGKNELFLSAFTYFWSVVPLVFMGLNKLIKNKKVLTGIICAIVIFVLVYNSIILYDIYSYAHSVFPFSKAMEYYFG